MPYRHQTLKWQEESNTQSKYSTPSNKENKIKHNR